MKITRVRWDGWDALRCVLGDHELVVGISAGPRILSLRRGGGPNLLYRDTTDFRVGEWRLHGGHRFTVGPEAERSYEPDSAPCAVEAVGRHVRIMAPPGGEGVQRIIDIGPAADGSGFDLAHRLVNRGPEDWTGALWAITCVPPTGLVVAACTDPRLRFWPDAARGPWTLGDGHVVLQPSGDRTKAGWYSERAWIASLQAAATLVVHCPDVCLACECGDGGCNVEAFACADYVELETLGAVVSVGPGRQATHRQRWRLLDPSSNPGEWRTIGQLAGCDGAAPDLRYAR